MPNEEKIREIIREEMKNQDLDKENVSVEMVREIFREEFPAMLKKSTFRVEGSIQLSDGRHIIVGSTTGTKIGTGTGQKIGFHGKTPTIQSASGNQAALALDVDVTGADTVDKSAIDSNFTDIQTLVNQLRTDLVNKGLIKGSA